MGIIHVQLKWTDWLIHWNTNATFCTGISVNCLNKVLLAVNSFMPQRRYMFKLTRLFLRFKGYVSSQNFVHADIAISFPCNKS